MIVACLGMLTADVTQAVAEYPHQNEKVSAKRTDFDFGGPAANAAATARALGSAVTLWTVVGGGPLAGAVVELVRNSGLALEDLAPPQAAANVTMPLSTVLITAKTGDRSVVASPALPAATVDPDRFPAQLAADVLLVDGHYLAAAVPFARLAQEKGIPVVLDGGSWKPGLEDLLPLVDVAILSADFVAPAPHQEALTQCSFVARTNGGNPVHLWGQDGNRCVLPVPAVPVVDTLGAGDVLHGAFAHFWAQEDSSLRLDFATVGACLDRAIRIAAKSCQAPRAKGWIENLSSDQWFS